MWKSITNLRYNKNGGDTCPRCSSVLHNGETQIPLVNDEYKKIKGKRCIKCDCLYIEDFNEVKALLKNNTKAKQFTIDGKSYYNASKEKESNRNYHGLLKFFNSDSSAFVMLSVEQFKDNKFRNDVKNHYVIVEDKSKENISKNILHYSNAFAREILAATFEVEKNHVAVFKGNRYSAFICRNGKRKLLKGRLLQEIVDEGIYIRHGGGYVDSEITKNNELKDILVYSFVTKRYELMESTFNDKKGMHYVDAQIYLKFVRRFGKTKRIITTFDWTSDSMINDKSIPSEFGYKSDLTDEERQGILSMLIDLDVVNIEYIVNWLHLNINLMKARQPDKESAIHSWEKDLHFILNYNSNIKCS